jgi:hypothetical protein
VVVAVVGAVGVAVATMVAIIIATAAVAWVAAVAPAAAAAPAAPPHQLLARVGAAPPGRPFTTPRLTPSTCGRACLGHQSHHVQAIVRLLCCIAGGATIHTSFGASASSSCSTTSVAVLDTVVRGVGSTVPRRLLRHHGAHSPHVRHRLGG